MAAGLIIFVRRGLEKIPIEIPTMSTVGDLLARVDTDGGHPQLYSNGVRLTNPTECLADIGIGSQCVLECTEEVIWWERCGGDAIIEQGGARVALHREQTSDYHMAVANRGCKSGDLSWSIEVYNPNGETCDITNVEVGVITKREPTDSLDNDDYDDDSVYWRSDGTPGGGVINSFSELEGLGEFSAKEVIGFSIRDYGLPTGTFSIYRDNKKLWEQSLLQTTFQDKGELFPFVCLDNPSSVLIQNWVPEEGQD